MSGEGRGLYVAAEGSDANPGTLTQPFATLERAREEIRTWKRSKTWPQPAGVTVWVRGGTYCRKASFELWTVDSGEPDAPIAYRAMPGETVRLVGGREIGGFTRVDEAAVLNTWEPPARANALWADVRQQGVEDFGTLKRRGFGVATAPAELELFYRDRRMPLTRWPNEGWATITSVPAGVKGGKLGYEGDRPALWTRPADILLHGYWYYWADTVERIRAIDGANRVIETVPPHGPYGYQAGKVFYAMNILEEMNDPGEWYLDRQTGRLYFWPPDPVAPSAVRVTVSTLESPLISLQGACHVTVRGLILECTRGMAVEIKGGCGNRIAGCTIRNTGTHGVVIEAVAPHLERSGNAVVSCDLYDLGETGIGLGGGERKTLNAGGNVAENNHIHHYARRARAGRPGISIAGVGNRIAHNLIHDTPHYAIMLSGNDHLIEFNHIHHAALESDDGGAFYMGRNMSCQGNVLRHNFWHDIGHLFEAGKGSHGVNTIFVDDGAGGLTVHGNVFCRGSCAVRPDYGAVFANGGKDMRIENNVFVDCEVAIGIADWGPGVLNAIIRTGGTEWSQWVMPWLYRDVDILRPPYRARYPDLFRLATEPEYRSGNRVARNLIWRCPHAIVETAIATDEKGNPDLKDGKWHYLTRESGYSPQLELRDNLTTDEDPGFEDAANMDFRLRPDSRVFRDIPGFEPIPFDRIGLYSDEYRGHIEQ